MECTSLCAYSFMLSHICTLLPVFYHHFLSVCFSLSFPRDISLSPVLQFIPLSHCLSFDPSISSVFLSLSFTHCFKFFIIASWPLVRKMHLEQAFPLSSSFFCVLLQHADSFLLLMSSSFFCFFLLHHF